ncbi:MAG: hypothetical protein ACYDBH_00555 [Acidobacteriaceae bacterium]
MADYIQPAQSTAPPEVDANKLAELGQRLFTLRELHISDRRGAEERWLQNLRQFRGIYDPEVLQMIPADMSKAYPKLTRWKVIGTIARLMQMLFPATERNFGIKASKLPNLSLAQLQEVLNTLTQTVSQSGDPSQIQLTDDQIEKAIRAYAKDRAAQMELKVDDDLKQMEYITLIRRVVFSAVLYNIGVLKGPMHVEAKARSWQRDSLTGQYRAIEKTKYVPLFEFMPVWDYYPDMTAQTLDKQDGIFERHIMTRAQVEGLADRPDFMKDRIDRYLRENLTGNYKPQWWESVIKGEWRGDKMYVASKETRKYELYAYWGTVTGHELKGAGIAVPEDKLGKSFQANAWIIDNIPIKVKLAPLGNDVKHHHVFMFEEDDLSVLGNGLCDTLRDSQLSLCETTRAALDNMSVIGPMVELNEDLLAPGQDMAIRKHKTWRREGVGLDAQVPAVRNINIESHLQELTVLRGQFLDFADKESGLPPASLGDTTGGGSEALRTQKNASMFLGAAALPIRDTVRNFDTFTISVVSSLVRWNTKFDPNPSRDGDHDVLARGSTSLIAKEVLSQALNEFRTSITPDEAPHLNSRAMLIARMKVNDLPVDDFLEDEDVANQKIQAQAQVAQEAQAAQTALVQAQAKNMVATAFMNMAKGEQADSALSVKVFETLMRALETGDKSNAAGVDAATKIMTEHIKGTYGAQQPTGGAGGDQQSGTA